MLHGDVVGGVDRPRPALRRAPPPARPALVIGPLHEAADVAECCAWLRAGAPAPAPSHLVAGVLASG
ncbi:hypothetical protein [Actinomycetospora atypica]|uniref:Uncharacterized protein n=1 Tax=Actinomycetospora atypica TaxID=1290095 RepID=A0ABV9YHS4_9PSEU